MKSYKIKTIIDLVYVLTLIGLGVLIIFIAKGVMGQIVG
jgi:hypothetical protein